ncbi:hypothetical protein CBP31_12665 [Oceanisphaera profunda]|uniref:Flagellar protein FliT n=1 Tax=Oceanisphaera profunda TaxID=1416627 RepID=A0A1Y0D773_9GAMM|nr:hypothetical protein [Oceanisphaera profunda]ART83370.1 hypothetical protein CBP31_12665 [Oceanisphaera profunda]
MSLLEQLKQVDESLLAEFASPESLQADTVEQRLAERARLLQLLMDTEMLDAEQVSELIERSRLLTQQAEQSRTVLAEKLASLQKGRRSVRAYGDVKKN